MDAPPTPHIFFLIELANPDRLLYLPDLSIASAKEHHSSDQPVQQDFRFLSSLNNNKLLQLNQLSKHPSY